MSGEPSQPIGRDRVDLPCIFVPGSHQGSRPSYAFGREPTEFRCIFTPEGYTGPPPGYPWIEFGRVMLDPEPTAGPFDQAARETSDAAASATGQPGAAAEPTMAPLPPEPASGEFGVYSTPPGTGGPRRVRPFGELGGYASPDITATMALWNWLSDPRAILAAVGAVSTTGPDLSAPMDKQHAAMRGSASGGILRADASIRQEPLPPLSPPAPTLPPTVNDTDLEGG